MAGCRLFTGYFVVRIFDSAARHPNSLNSPLPATMPPGTARVRRRSASELGGRGERSFLSGSDHAAFLNFSYSQDFSASGTKSVPAVRSTLSNH